MANIITAGFKRLFGNRSVSIERQRIDKAKASMLRLVKIHAPQGRGLDLPDVTDPRRAYLAVAAQELVNESNGALTIQRFQDRLTLVDARVTGAFVSSETIKQLEQTAFTAKPGDDPFASFDPEMVNKGPTRGSSEGGA